MVSVLAVVVVETLLFTVHLLEFPHEIAGPYLVLFFLTDARACSRFEYFVFPDASECCTLLPFFEHYHPLALLYVTTFLSTLQTKFSIRLDSSYPLDAKFLRKPLHLPLCCCRTGIVVVVVGNHHSPGPLVSSTPLCPERYVHLLEELYYECTAAPQHRIYTPKHTRRSLF